MADKLEVTVGWTVETLLITVEKVLDEREKYLAEQVRLQEQLIQVKIDAGEKLLVALAHEREIQQAQFAVTQEKALDTAFRAQEKAVTEAFASAKEAVTKAETAADKQFQALSEKIVDLQNRQSLSDQAIFTNAASIAGSAAGSQRTQTLVFAVVGSLVAIGGFVLAFVSS